MKSKFAVVVLMLTAWSCLACSAARAAVVVLANRTDREVRFTVSSAPGPARDYTLAAREVLPLAMTRRMDVTFAAGDTPRRCRLKANAIYCFLRPADSLELREVGLGGSWDRPARSADKDELAAPDAKPARILIKVPVTILVDQGEPTARKAWEERLRKRVEAASAALERYCRVKLEVIGAATWESDGRLTTLSDLLHDFQRKVLVKPGHLAIGFTSQFAARNGDRKGERRGDRALGCCPGPLCHHILIREWVRQKSESEYVEVVLHEVGHFLGASHSPETDSVMRPNLGDARANIRAFRLGFDPLNTLVLNLVAEELSRRPALTPREFSPECRDRLLDVFTALAKAMPDDPAARQFIRLLGGTAPEALRVRPLPPAVVIGARMVVAAVTSAAERNARLPASSGAANEGRSRRSGDALTAYYCQAAAEASRRLPAEQAVPAYLLGLAIALDRTALLHDLGLSGIPWRKIETAPEQVRRLKVLGEPTAHGRPELVRHFVISAALAALAEGQAVSAGGILGELLRAEGSERFRFDDLSASLAGIAFATQLDASPGLLTKLATSFRIADYVPASSDLSENLSREEFNRAYGSTSDARFRHAQDALRKQLLTLPGYQPRDRKPSKMR